MNWNIFQCRKPNNRHLTCAEILSNHIKIMQNCWENVLAVVYDTALYFHRSNVDVLICSAAVWNYFRLRSENPQRHKLSVLSSINECWSLHEKVRPNFFTRRLPELNATNKGLRRSSWWHLVSTAPTGINQISDYRWLTMALVRNSE